MITALHWAASHGFNKIVDQLIKADAKLDLKDKVKLILSISISSQIFILIHNHMSFFLVPFFLISVWENCPHLCEREWREGT